MQYSPYSSVVFTDYLSNLRNGHFSGKRQNESFKQRCKTALRSCPIRYKLSHTALIAPDFRISEMNVALLLTFPLSCVSYEHKGTAKQAAIDTISEKEKIMGTKNKK